LFNEYLGEIYKNKNKKS